MNLIAMIIIGFIIITLGIITFFNSYNMVTGQNNETINPDNLTTLDRMRFTAIQMTILDLETSTPTNISNDEIAKEIYKYQQGNSSDRLTTLEIEDLYRNITNGTQVGPEIQQ
jgi:hypothetical protein